jgi:hypothetical protein
MLQARFWDTGSKDFIKPSAGETVGKVKRKNGFESIGKALRCGRLRTYRTQ